MQESQILNLSIGDRVPDRRLSASAHSGRVNLKGKEVLIDVSADAVRAASVSRLPVLAELELYFSCLVRKRVRFPATEARGYPLDSAHPKLALQFHPIVGHHCSLEEMGPEQAHDDLALAKPDAFTPRWVSLDYRNGQWSGDFGYAGQ